MRPSIVLKPCIQIFITATFLLGTWGCDEPSPPTQIIYDELDTSYSDTSSRPFYPTPGTGKPGTPPGDPLEDVGDVEDGGGDDSGDEPPQNFCNATPREPDNLNAWPCCFDDLDCYASPHPESQNMRCYGAQCHTGGEGVCRPVPINFDECWGDEDCLVDEVCTLSTLRACGEVPGLQTPGQCRPL